MKSRRERNRQEWDAILRDRYAHERPNVPPTPIDPKLDCPASKYRTHRFTATSVDGLTCCEFCDEPLRAWLDKKRTGKRG